MKKIIQFITNPVLVNGPKLTTIVLLSKAKISNVSVVNTPKIQNISQRNVPKLKSVVVLVNKPKVSNISLLLPKLKAAILQEYPVVLKVKQLQETKPTTALQSAINILSTLKVNYPILQKYTLIDTARVSSYKFLPLPHLYHPVKQRLLVKQNIEFYLQRVEASKGVNRDTVEKFIPKGFTDQVIGIDPPLFFNQKNPLRLINLLRSKNKSDVEKFPFTNKLITTNTQSKFFEKPRHNLNTLLRNSKVDILQTLKDKKSIASFDTKIHNFYINIEQINRQAFKNIGKSSVSNLVRIPDKFKTRVSLSQPDRTKVILNTLKRTRSAINVNLDLSLFNDSTSFARARQKVTTNSISRHSSRALFSEADVLKGTTPRFPTKYSISSDFSIKARRVVAQRLAGSEDATIIPRLRPFSKSLLNQTKPVINFETAISNTTGVRELFSGRFFQVKRSRLLIKTTPEISANVAPIARSLLGSKPERPEMFLQKKSITRFDSRPLKGRFEAHKTGMSSSIYALDRQKVFTAKTITNADPEIRPIHEPQHKISFDSRPIKGRFEAHKVSFNQRITREQNRVLSSRLSLSFNTKNKDFLLTFLKTVGEVSLPVRTFIDSRPIKGRFEAHKLVKRSSAFRSLTKGLSSRGNVSNQEVSLKPFKTVVPHISFIDSRPIKGRFEAHKTASASDNFKTIGKKPVGTTVSLSMNQNPDIRRFFKHVEKAPNKNIISHRSLVIKGVLVPTLLKTQQNITVFPKLGKSSTTSGDTGKITKVIGKVRNSKGQLRDVQIKGIVFPTLTQINSVVPEKYMNVVNHSTNTGLLDIISTGPHILQESAGTFKSSSISKGFWRAIRARISENIDRKDSTLTTKPSAVGLRNPERNKSGILFGFDFNVPKDAQVGRNAILPARAFFPYQKFISKSSRLDIAYKLHRLDTIAGVKTPFSVFITKSGFFTTNRTKNVLLPARAVLPVSRAVSKTPILDIIYILRMLTTTGRGHNRLERFLNKDALNSRLASKNLVRPAYAVLRNIKASTATTYKSTSGLILKPSKLIQKSKNITKISTLVPHKVNLSQDVFKGILFALRGALATKATPFLESRINDILRFKSEEARTLSQSAHNSNTSSLTDGYLFNQNYVEDYLLEPYVGQEEFFGTIRFPSV